MFCQLFRAEYIVHFPRKSCKHYTQIKWHQFPNLPVLQPVAYLCMQLNETILAAAHTYPLQHLSTLPSFSQLPPASALPAEWLHSHPRNTGSMAGVFALIQHPLSQVMSEPDLSSASGMANSICLL